MPLIDANSTDSRRVDELRELAPAGPIEAGSQGGTECKEQDYVIYILGHADKHCDSFLLERVRMSAPQQKEQGHPAS